jgi:tagaturonate reductase
MAQPILQFGTGRFLQAHVDLIVAQALARGEALGGIAMVQSTASAHSSARLAAARALGRFPIRLQGLVHGEAVDRQEWVDSVRETLHADTQWPALVDAFAQARVVVSNTADAGFRLDARDDASLMKGDRVPRSFPAKLVVLLHARWQRDAASSLSLFPTELVSRNGDVLRETVLEVARDWRLADAFIAYLQERCVWVNSLVDRIVSAPLEPIGAVAEPYALWAIERRPGMTPPCSHPDVSVADDISSHERLKLFVLNLAHTWLVDEWMRSNASVRTVLDAMHEPRLRNGLEAVWANEVIPVFDALGSGAQARAYVDVVRERLCNPFLAHALSDIAANHEEKKRRRIGALLQLAGRLGLAPAQARLRKALA